MPIRDLDDIFVPPSRIRKDFPSDKQEELIASILTTGLLHPPVVEMDGALLAGERRLRALQEIARRGLEHRCNGKTLRAGLIFTTDIKDLTPLGRMTAEYEENVIRHDLSWQEKAEATAALHALREAQKVEHSIPGLPAPSQSLRETASEIKDRPLEEVTRDDIHDIRADLLVNAWIKDHADPDVENAKTRAEALKIIERKLEDGHRQALGRRFKQSHAGDGHILLQGSLLDLLPDTPNNTYDCIITDPPWGAGANKWTNGNSLREHTYLDDMHTSEKIHLAIAKEGYRITKPKAHLYLVCAHQNFETWARMFRSFGWDVWPRPLIWYKGSNNGIAPRPEHGPQNSYECILFANKGDKRIVTLRPDVILMPMEGSYERAAQKPIGLYAELLSRSVIPGDEVLDPCCGTGPIFPAANLLKVRATGYDLDDIAIGIASERLRQQFTRIRWDLVAQRPRKAGVRVKEGEGEDATM